MPSGSASARSRACPRSAWQPSSSAAATATIPCATSGCAPASMSATIERLAEADAFRSIGLDRRAALWAVRALDRNAAPPRRLPLFDRPGIRLRDNEPETRLPVMPLGEHVIHDYRSLGLSLKAHPVSFLRARLDRSGVTPNERLAAVRERPAASPSPASSWCASGPARATPSS